MQTMMIDLPAIAPRIPQGKAVAGGAGQSFADFFKKLPVDLREVTQEEGLAGLLAVLTSASADVSPQAGEMSLLESLLKDSSQLDPELRTALAQGQQVGSDLLAEALQGAIELPVTVAPQGPAELPVTVAPQGPAELSVTVAPQGPAELSVTVAPQGPVELLGSEPKLGVKGTLPPMILAGEVMVSPVVQRENMANATMIKELPTMEDADNVPLVAVMPNVESGQRQKPVSKEAPALLDNMLEKMLGQESPGRRQLISARNGISEQSQRQELPFDLSNTSRNEVKPPTVAAAALESVHQAITSLLQPGNDAAVVVAESPVFNETGLPGGQPLAARQAAMPDPTAVPGTGLRLSSGALIPEERLVDQVIGRLSIDRGRESSSMTMKLHPEELGEVKLSLQVEKETVKALLVVQSQQVQEVLDRHMPRLREALAQQGLKLEDMQVSVDSGHGDGHKGLFQDQRQATTPFHFAVQRGGVAPTGNELPVQLGQGPMKSGLSIRI